MLVITAFLCKVITFMTLQEHTFNTPAKFHLIAEEATKCGIISKQKMYISYNMKILLLNIDIKSLNLLPEPYYRWFQINFSLIQSSMEYRIQIV